jgi:hypothetical protein
MSVVIATPDKYQVICKTVDHLRGQTVSGDLELVIVAPSAERLDLHDSELKDFFGVRVLEVGEIRSVAWANAAGIRATSAPVVALAEDHCFPDPGWAEALIEAHKKQWAVVGPVVRNANPNSTISWAGFVMSYGPWLSPEEAGEMDHLPGHNSSYKRSILLKYDADLEEMLEAESVLHWDLKAKGYRLYLEPMARVSHLNYEILSSWLMEQYYSGRVFAAVRARDWPHLKKLFFTVGAPLIPGIRIYRILKEMSRSRQTRGLIRSILAPLIVGVVVRSMGEMVGYALGRCKGKNKVSHFEFQRLRNPGFSQVPEPSHEVV